ncbi:protein of unknown function, might belong to Transcriptional regulator, LysR family protein [Shewanella benthica]|uniref:Uncharacterized protein n=1 Tax=Shewanella benthica TaxID=43661 RepID=A0A330LV44_9GAMM|nr:protein of unknown function, might belong to Transcriptional regulator, LysR family protein [Shewanella benthica]
MTQTKVIMSFPQRAYLPKKYRVFIEFIYESLSQNPNNILLETPDFISMTNI